MRTLKKGMTYLVIILAACVGALNYQLFVFPNQFAPSGLNGICTMIQYLFHISVGYMSLLVNIPLAIIVFFKVSKSLALRSMVYVGVFSVMLLLLERVDLSGIAYDTASSAILGPLVAGIINGAIYAALVSAGAYSGGTDYVASLIHKYKPSVNFFWTVFALNAVVAVLSFFVYGYKIEPVLLCIIYSYFSSSIRDNMNRKHQGAVRCEIVTNEGEKLGHEIIEKLHHSVTKLTGTGLYTGKEKEVLVCIINPTQLNELTKVVSRYPDSFVTVSHIDTVMGKFARLDSHNNPEKDLFDNGANP